MDVATDVRHDLALGARVILVHEDHESAGTITLLTWGDDCDRCPLYEVTWDAGGVEVCEREYLIPLDPTVDDLWSELMAGIRVKDGVS